MKAPLLKTIQSVYHLALHPFIHSFTSGFQTEQSGVVNRNVHSTVSKFQVPLQKPICYSASLNCYLESITQLQTQTSGHDRLVHLDVHLQDRRLKKKTSHQASPNIPHILKSLKSPLESQQITSGKQAHCISF